MEKKALKALFVPDNREKNQFIGQESGRGRLSAGHLGNGLVVPDFIRSHFRAIRG
jgi:hypothetical protein